MKKTGTGNRRLIPIGGSVGITLPKSFLKKKGWKAGDKVGLVFDDVAVIVRPAFKEE
jgi:antitoxin component of MazEF toxin-antitoxin module